MKLLPLVCVLLVKAATLALAEQPPPPSPSPDIKATEYSLASGEPYPTEVNLAYRRFWKFLQHPNAKGRASLMQTPFVAVQVGSYRASDVPPAMARIAGGRAQAMSHYGSDPDETALAELKFVIVFDSRDRRFVGPRGVFVSDTPNIGEIGKFGGIAAVYAGTR
jgi:hypothetical protein